MPAPNILLILTDQQRTDSLGCYGGRHVPTPHLDRLAAQGTTFDACYGNSPLCTPCRASLWTGRSVLGHGVYTLHDILPDDETLFPWHLRELGYHTALFGKLHVSGRMKEVDEAHPRHGFDVYENSLSPYNFNCRHHAYRDWLRQRSPAWYEKIERDGTKAGYIPADCHFSTWITERTIDLINRRPGDRPFFYCASFVDPHDPFDDHPESALADVSLGPMEVVERSTPDLCRLPALQREVTGGVLGSVSDYTDEEIRRMRRSYYASVGFLDRCVGQILATLDQAGLRENTWVIFTSDHGEMLGERCLLGKGAYFYDACARVPLLLRAPAGHLPPGRSGRLVQMEDLAATIMRAAGTPVEAVKRQMPATYPLQDSAPRPTAVGIYRNTGINSRKQFWDPPIHATMLRTDTHKLTAYHDPSGRSTLGGELYDMIADPTESDNLWNTPAAAALQAELLLRLADWLVAQDLAHGRGGRGGRLFPSPGRWLPNNPIRR
jgi:arylsulfatase